MICGILDKFKSKVIPSNVKLQESQFEDPPQAILSLQYFFLPIQSILVFDRFIFNPDNDPNISKMFKVCCKELSEPSINIVVSSANCEILNSPDPILIPFMLLFVSIISHNICAHKIKR